MDLAHFLQMSQGRINDLEEVKENQKQQIIELCKEKDTWQEERKLLENIFLELKRKTLGILGKMEGRKFELGKMIKKAKEQKLD